MREIVNVHGNPVIRKLKLMIRQLNPYHADNVASYDTREITSQCFYKQRNRGKIVKMVCFLENALDNQIAADLKQHGTRSRKHFSRDIRRGG